MQHDCRQTGWWHVTNNNNMQNPSFITVGLCMAGAYELPVHGYYCMPHPLSTAIPTFDHLIVSLEGAARP